VLPLRQHLVTMTKNVMFCNFFGGVLLFFHSYRYLCSFFILWYWQSEISWLIAYFSLTIANNITRELPPTFCKIR
jgi:hypothetical protein